MATSTSVHVPLGQPLKGAATLLDTATLAQASDPFVCLTLTDASGNKVDVFLRSAADLAEFREAVNDAHFLLAQVDATRAVQAKVLAQNYTEPSWQNEADAIAADAAAGKEV